MLLALVWYCLFWVTLGSYARDFGRPDPAVAAVYLALAPAAAMVHLAAWLGFYPPDFPRD